MTRLFILQQKLLNIPEKPIICHDKKSVRAYNNVIMMSQTASLNIAIKNVKQANNR